jgi:hypothetical protein
MGKGCRFCLMVLPKIVYPLKSLGVFIWGLGLKWVMGGLIGILIGIPPKKGEPEDLQVKPETPVFQIKNIVFHTLCNRRLPAPSVQRCPSVIEMFLPKTALG